MGNNLNSLQGIGFVNYGTFKIAHCAAINKNQINPYALSGSMLVCIYFRVVKQKKTNFRKIGFDDSIYANKNKNSLLYAKKNLIHTSIYTDY